MQQEIETPTAVGAALRAAGYQTAAERLASLMAAAIRIGNGLREPSIVAFEQMLLADDDAAALIWELMAEVRKPAMSNLFGRTLHELREQQKSKSKSRQQAGHAGHDDQKALAQPAAETPHQPRAPGQAIDGSHGRLARAPAVQTAPERAIERARKHHLRAQVINGRLLDLTSAGELRAWGNAQGVWVRFAGLITEGMPDTMLIGERTDEELEFAWRLATSATNA